MPFDDGADSANTLETPGGPKSLHQTVDTPTNVKLRQCIHKYRAQTSRLSLKMKHVSAQLLEQPDEVQSLFDGLSRYKTGATLNS